MGGYWFITKKQRLICVNNYLYHDKWTCDTPRVVEVIIVLEAVKVIVKKRRKIIQGSIIVMNNNFKLIQIINNELSPIQLASEAAAEVTAIKELIQLAQFNIVVK